MALQKVTITESVSRQLLETLKIIDFTKVAVLVDENTVKHCYPILKKMLPDHSVIQIKSGEEFKNIDTCNTIWSELTALAFDRKSLLVNIGGGVIGDMGGFCARTYKRGIQFINIPTTLLAQVDASMGGKLGVDFNGLKNHIGLFSDPEQVIIDPIFLKTLPMQELKSGYAEVIKHNLIFDSTNWKELVEIPFESIDWVSTIRHSVEVKEMVVKNDPLERGQRKILNFGHTIGHALETYRMMHDKRILHGEAVAAGMIMESFVSFQKGFITQSQLREIENYIDSLFERITIEENEISMLNEYTIQDKKNKGNIIYAALLDDIGSARWDIELTSDEVVQSIRYYANYT